MKKVLVTGAAGSIGLNVIKYLLSEGKYEITALDLKNKKVYKRLKPYRKRVNIVYGDILDRTLVENLVKESDIVINLATCLPPMANYQKDLSNIIEYNGTENIVRAICYYNPKCYLIYGSTTSLYSKEKAGVYDKITLEENDYFNVAKIRTEELITKKMKNYCILRLPLVLTDLRYDPFIYNVDKYMVVEVITKEDAAYAFCAAIDKKNSVNGKILNIGGGETCHIEYRKLLYNLIKYHGLSFKFITSTIFLNKTYRSPVLTDSNDANKILKFQSDSLQSYYMRQKRRSKNRKVSKFLGKIYLAFTKKGTK